MITTGVWKRKFGCLMYFTKLFAFVMLILLGIPSSSIHRIKYLDGGELEDPKKLCASLSVSK
jgi:hypothetical protein